MKDQNVYVSAYKWIRCLQLEAFVDTGMITRKIPKFLMERKNIIRGGTLGSTDIIKKLKILHCRCFFLLLLFVCLGGFFWGGCLLIGWGFSFGCFFVFFKKSQVINCTDLPLIPTVNIL